METPTLPTVALATFTTQPPRGGRAESFEVHFNPESLQYTVSNTLKDEGSGKKKKQYVDKTEAKLSMTLVFDTTHSGEDVRTYTDKTAKLLQPVSEGKKQVPPNVEFGWGAYSFKGMVEQYKETLDFFSAEGVPLRASVELTLASQDVQFDSARNPATSVDGANATDTPVVPAAGGNGPSGLANQLGDPRAARAIAAANGAGSLRFGGEAGLAIAAGIELKAEAAFSVGASAGAGLSPGVGAGGGIGFGLSGGAFGGLRSGARQPGPLPDAGAVFSASASFGGGASFGAGGQLQASASGGLSADVGAEADLNALIRFE